jgi:hypothetical protein
MRLPALFSLVTAGTITLAAGGCGDDSGPSASLAGIYSLASIRLPGQPAITPPDATGTLTLAASGTYTLRLEIQGQGTLEDAGTYAATGTQWSQMSPTTGQSTGTYTLNGNTLTITATNQAGTSISVWQRQ